MKTKTKSITAALLFALSFTSTFGQNQTKSSSETFTERKISVSTTYLSFVNFREEKTNTHHYEFHVGYKLTPKDKIGIKLATWKMFAPMGMPMQEQLKYDENNFYPGRLRESGIGVTYQRMLWKDLFATVEVLPVNCMFRTGFQCGFPSGRDGKTIVKPGTGNYWPRYEIYKLLWLRFLNFSFFQFKNGRCENQPAPSNSHFKIQGINFIRV